MKAKILGILKTSFWVVVVMIVIGAWSALSYFGIKTFQEQEEELSWGEAGCSVIGINLHGEVVTYHSNDAYNEQGGLAYDQTSADDVISLIAEAEADESIGGIILEVDSSGGSPVAGEEMMLAIKQAKKPTVAFIRDIGASSAYLAATGADVIFASRFSDIGSIGLTMSYLQESEKNREEGLTYIDLSSGKFKDSGSPNRAITAEEKEIFMRDIKIGHDNFVRYVAENRQLDIAVVRKLADGSTLAGESALKAGLIDKIGTLADAEEFLAKKIGTTPEVCWVN